MKVAVMTLDEFRRLTGVPKGYRTVSACLNDQDNTIEVYFEPIEEPWQAVFKPQGYQHHFNPRADNFLRDAASLPYPYSQ